MKLVLVAGLLSGYCWGASFSAIVSGNWNNAATWGGRIPGNQDTISIKDGVTVTVSDPRIIGMSGANGTAAIELGYSGALVIASGGVLQVRGDIVYSSGAGTANAPYLTVQAGGIFEWDSTQAAAPRATKYNAHPDGNYGFRGFVATGTEKSHAIVRSHAGGGNGYFGLGGHSVGGSYTATYTDFLRIGDAANPAFARHSSGLGNNPTPWDFTHNTFTSCGMAPSSTGNMAGGDVFRHDFNVHSRSLGTAILSLPGDPAATAAICTTVGKPKICTAVGKREIAGNIFDILAASDFDARDFIIHSNYFGGGFGTANAASHTWWYFQNNFYRMVQSPVSSLTAAGDVRDCIFFWDEIQARMAHAMTFSAAGPEMITGNILDHTGDVSTHSSFVSSNAPLAPGTIYTVRANILLPNAAGHASMAIASIVQCCGNEGSRFDIDHNTYFGERPTGINQDAIDTAETGSNPGGQLDSFRSNILWANAPGSFYKLLALSNTNTDVCPPARCDYNDGWNTKADGANFTNGGRGYAENFSRRPGVHDRATDPMFVDASRNTATFDSAYLHNTAPAWNADAAYKAGDMVSSADPTVYKGAAINYRYVDGPGCSKTNPKPGLYTAESRACWEWASLYRIRQGVRAQKLYDDPTIGAHGVDIITVLIQWIRAGFSPGNAALVMAGHDGQDIGAVPVTFAAPSSSEPKPRTPAVR